MNKFLHFNVILNSSATQSQRKKYQSRTLAIAPVPAQEIRDIAKHFLNLSGSNIAVGLEVGVTFLSIKDRYSKKEGREQATKRMTPVSLDVHAVQVTQTHIFIQLAEHKGVTLVLRLNKRTNFSTVTGNLTIGA